MRRGGVVRRCGIAGGQWPPLRRCTVVRWGIGSLWEGAVILPILGNMTEGEKYVIDLSPSQKSATRSRFLPPPVAVPGVRLAADAASLPTDRCHSLPSLDSATGSGRVAPPRQRGPSEARCRPRRETDRIRRKPMRKRKWCRRAVEGAGPYGVLRWCILGAVKGAGPYGVVRWCGIAGGQWPPLRNIR